MTASVERFSDRVENYVKYRPGYPTEIVDLLSNDCGLTPSSIISDLGSGPGKLTEIFLKNGNPVFGVEPNAGMRAAAERLLASYPNFKSVEGSAEQTTLPDSSVDFITAGQAFHWFNPTLAHSEAKRILKPGGWVALIWNERKLQSTRFLEDYESLLLQYGTDYQIVRHDRAVQAIADFFAPSIAQSRVFPNQQVFDFEGLKGRVLSSSYTPQPDHPDFEPMLEQLRQIFDEHQQHGYVVFDYDTRVFYGQI